VVVVVATVGRALLLAWDVSAVQEEPWRRLLQELSGCRIAQQFWVIRLAQVAPIIERAVERGELPG
jgi:hypothetical protein